MNENNAAWQTSQEEWLKSLQVGSVVRRMLAGTIPMMLRVSAIDDQFIHCGPWKFLKSNGGEIDEDLGAASGLHGVYASYIREPTKEELEEPADQNK